MFRKHTSTSALPPDVKRVYDLLSPKPKELLAHADQRCFIREGECEVNDGKDSEVKSRFLFLFNDMLLITKRMSARTFRLKIFVCLHEGLRVESAKEQHVLKQVQFKIISSKISLSFFARNEDDRQLWLSLIRGAIELQASEPLLKRSNEAIAFVAEPTAEELAAASTPTTGEAQPVTEIKDESDLSLGDISAPQSSEDIHPLSDSAEEEEEGEGLDVSTPEQSLEEEEDPEASYKPLPHLPTNTTETSDDSDDDDDDDDESSAKSPEPTIKKPLVDSPTKTQSGTSSPHTPRREKEDTPSTPPRTIPSAMRAPDSPGSPVSQYVHVRADNIPFLQWIGQPKPRQAPPTPQSDRTTWDAFVHQAPTKQVLSLRECLTSLAAERHTLRERVRLLEKVRGDPHRGDRDLQLSTKLLALQEEGAERERKMREMEALLLQHQARTQRSTRSVLSLFILLVACICYMVWGGS